MVKEWEEIQEEGTVHRYSDKHEKPGLAGGFTYRGASEYELGSMGSNSSSFRLAAIEISSWLNSSLKAQGAPDQ